MIYGLIIAAGKQSRFKSEIPKAVMPISKQKTILDINIATLNTRCDISFVVCGKHNSEYFNQYNNIIIDSGKGCGDAVMQALAWLRVNYNLDDNDQVVVQWGDSIQFPEVITKMFTGNTNYVDLVLPCRIEHNPYVMLTQESSTAVSIRFSKYGEVPDGATGYHDQSIFLINRPESVYDKMLEYAISISSDGHYINEHGNEFNFLDMCSFLKSKIVDVGTYSALWFNTMEEFNKIKDELCGLNIGNE